jgi:hypothetical protein
MTKLNIGFLVIAAAAILAIGNAQTSRTPTTPSGQAGRYQLLSGEIEFGNLKDKTGASLHRIFRIDTATGATSYYREMINQDGAFVSEWYSIK